MLSKLRLSPEKTLVGIISFSVLARVLVAVLLGDGQLRLPGVFDQISYHALATRVLEGHGFSFEYTWWPNTAAGSPTAHWSFLYTGFLAAVYALFGKHPLAARLIQAVLAGLLQPWLAYLIGRRLFSTRVGIVAAALTGGYAYFIYYAATLMTEAFYFIAIMACFYIAILLVENHAEVEAVPPSPRRQVLLAVGLGVTLGVTILLRQIFMLFVPFLFLWLWWAMRARRTRGAFLVIALASLVIAGMILPITFYNYIRFNQFVLLNTNAGFAFYWANHPIHGTKFIPILPRDLTSYQALIPRELRSLNEAALDRALLIRGFEIVLDDPIRYLKLSVTRIPPYFMFWPSSDSNMFSNIARVGSFGVLWPIMLYGIAVTLRSRHTLPENGRDFHNSGSVASWLATPNFLLLLFAVVYSLIHILSWTLVRYRLPVDAIMLVFASLGLVTLSRQLMEWTNKWKSHRNGSTARVTVDRR